MGAEQTRTSDLRCKEAKDARIITDLQTERNNMRAVAQEDKPTRENLGRATDDRTVNLKREVIISLEAQNEKLQHGIQGWNNAVAGFQKQIESKKHRRVKEQRQCDEVGAVMHSPTPERPTQAAAASQQGG
jgi:rhamnose utilization protein RhaD (predicted bifunctional aldolase and dehydrogenase)